MRILQSRPISAFGGINFVYEHLDSLGVGKLINQNLPKLAKQSKYSWKDISYSFFGIYLCGGGCIEDLELNLKHHIGNTPYCKIPSPDTVLTRFKSLSEESKWCRTKRGIVDHQYSLNNTLGCLNIELLKKMGQFEGIDNTLDYDNTIIFNEKSDSKMSYKRDFGYQPGVCTINAEHVIYIENRNGNSDAKSYQHETLQRMFDMLKLSKINKMDNFRADGASYQYEVINLLEKEVRNFYISARISYVAKYFKKIKKWVKTKDNIGEDVWIGEIDYTPFVNQARKNGHKASRYRLVVKKKVKDEGQIDIETQDACEYRAIITNNRSLSAEEVVQFYNQRGKMERQFDVLKNDFGWNKMTFSKLNQNTVFLYFTAICKNIYHRLITHFSKKVKGLKPTDRIKKFIFRFIVCPAKWVKKSRQQILRIYWIHPLKI